MAINKPKTTEKKQPAINQIIVLLITTKKSGSEKKFSKFLKPIKPRFFPKKYFEKLKTNVSYAGRAINKQTASIPGSINKYANA